MASLKYLRQELDAWKTLLRLGDWDITLSWGSSKFMKDTVGLNIFSGEERVSNIYILKGLPDQEALHTLVHELLHLILDGWKSIEAPYSVLHERSINDVARVLVQLKYAQ